MKASGSGSASGGAGEPPADDGGRMKKVVDEQHKYVSPITEMKASGSGSASGGAGESPADDGGKMKKVVDEQHKYVSLTDVIKQSEAEESSESDGGEETEPRVFRPRIFPAKFSDHIKKSDYEDEDEFLGIQFRVLAEKRLCSANIRKNRLPFTAIATPAGHAPAMWPTAGEDAAFLSGTGVGVLVIEPDGQTVNSSLTLQRRLAIKPLAQPERYVLSGAWSELVARHGDALERGKLVRIWWFRRRDGEGRERLWLALDVVDERAGECEVALKMAEKWHFDTNS